MKSWYTEGTLRFLLVKRKKPLLKMYSYVNKMTCLPFNEIVICIEIIVELRVLKRENYWVDSSVTYILTIFLKNIISMI